MASFGLRSAKGAEASRGGGGGTQPVEEHAYQNVLVAEQEPQSISDQLRLNPDICGQEAQKSQS